MPFAFCPLWEGLGDRTVLASRGFLRGRGSVGGRVPIPQMLSGDREHAPRSSVSHFPPRVVVHSFTYSLM